MKNTLHKSNKSGFALILGIIVVTILIILSTSQFDRLAAMVRFGNNKVLEQQAINAAEAGLEHAIFELNQNAGNWYGTGTEQTIGTTATFFTTITDKSPGVKSIISTGYIPNSINPRKQVAIKSLIVISGETIAFNFAVITGNGGVTMSQSATINGNIHSNGNITAGGGNQQTITGEAYAVGTIESPPITVDSGVIEEFQNEENMPIVDYQFWKDAASTGGTIDCAITPLLCDISGGTANIGPSQYLGDLIISNQAVVTIEGPIYVTGDVTVRNGGTQVNLSQTFGSNGTVFISDGIITVEQGGAFNPTSATPPGYILVVTTSTNSAAMQISNSGANAVFYALEGGTILTQTANVNSLVANILTMDNSSSLTYASGLASAKFSSGPGGAYVIKKGSYQYTK